MLALLFFQLILKLVLLTDRKYHPVSLFYELVQILFGYFFDFK